MRGLFHLGRAIASGRRVPRWPLIVLGVGVLVLVANRTPVFDQPRSLVGHERVKVVERIALRGLGLRGAGKVIFEVERPGGSRLKAERGEGAPAPLGGEACLRVERRAWTGTLAGTLVPLRHCRETS